MDFNTWLGILIPRVRHYVDCDPPELDGNQAKWICGHTVIQAMAQGYEVAITPPIPVGGTLTPGIAIRSNPLGTRLYALQESSVEQAAKLIAKHIIDGCGLSVHGLDYDHWIESVFRHIEAVLPGDTNQTGSLRTFGSCQFSYNAIADEGDMEFEVYSGLKRRSTGPIYWRNEMPNDIGRLVAGLCEGSTGQP